MAPFKTIGITLVVIGLLILAISFAFVDAESRIPVFASSIPLFGLAAALMSRKDPTPKE